MCSENVTLEPVEKRVEEELGRELTPREKFYLALAEACTPSSDHSQDVEYQKAGWSLALSLNKFLPKLGINSHVFGA